MTFAVDLKRVFGRAKVDPDHRLRVLLADALSVFPQGVPPMKSVTKLQLRKRGSMEGLVGLTTYCCVEAEKPPRGPDGHATQKITFYSELFDELSDSACIGVIAHELAHAWLNEHDRPEESAGREEEADGLARRWGYSRYLEALAAETEPP